MLRQVAGRHLGLRMVVIAVDHVYLAVVAQHNGTAIGGRVTDAATVVVTVMAVDLSIVMVVEYDFHGTHQRGHQFKRIGACFQHSLQLLGRQT